MIDKNLKSGDIVYHHTGYNPWVVVFNKMGSNNDVLGFHCVNINSEYKNTTYQNHSIKELRLATQEERELLFRTFPKLRNKYQPIEPQYEIY